MISPFTPFTLHLLAIILTVSVCAAAAVAQFSPIPASKTGVDLTNTVPGEPRPAVLKFGMAGDSNEFVVGCYDTSGIDMAFKEINDKGGAKGTKLELVFDHTPNSGPDIAQALFNQVMHKDVFAFVQTAIGGTHYVHPTVAKPNGIPMLNPITAAPLEEPEVMQHRAEVNQVGFHLVNMALHGPAKCSKFGIVALNLPVMLQLRKSMTDILLDMGLGEPAFVTVPLPPPTNKTHADAILDPLFDNATYIPHCMYVFASSRWMFWNSYIRRHPKADPETAFFHIPMGTPTSRIHDVIDGSTSWFKHKVFIVQAFSHPMHPTSQLAAEYRAALATYTYGPNRTQCPRTPSSPLQFEAYTTGRLVAEIVSRMSTFTREEFMNTVYRTKMFNINDLTLGPFNDRCEGLSGEETISCFCNSGGRTVYATEIDERGDLARVADDHTVGEFGSSELRIPMQRCYYKHVTESVPTVTRFTTVHPEGDSSFAASMMRHVVAYNREGQKSGRMHRVYAINGSYDPNQKTAAEVSKRLVDRYNVALYVGGSSAAVPPTSLHFDAALPSSGKLPTSPVPFNEFRINFLPRMQEYVHTLVGYYYATSSARAEEGLKQLQVITDSGELAAFARKSVETITRAEVAIHIAEDIASTMANADGDAVLLVVSDTIDGVRSAVSTATANPQRLVLIAASEDHLLEANPGTHNVSSNFYFASMFPAFWRSDASPFAKELFDDESVASTYLGPINRTSAPTTSPTPAELRAALQAFVLSTAMNEQAKTAVQLKEWIFEAGAHGVHGIPIGPMAVDLCEESHGARCECNNAIQTFHVHKLHDWFSTSRPSTYFFYTNPECNVVYRSLPVNKLAIGLIVGVTAGVIAALAAIVGIVAAFKSGRRDTSSAPKDPAQPFAIVFTDIQSSTTLWAEMPEEMAEAVELHHQTIRKLIAEHNGYEVKTIGDAFMVAFQSPLDAMKFALSVQQALFEVDWGTTGFDEVYKEHMRNAMEAQGKVDEAQFIGQSDPTVWKGLRVRVGVNYGSGSIQKDEVTQGYDYYGTVVNTAARVESIGNGGQVLLTEAVNNAVFESDSVSRPVQTSVVDLGPQLLRGLTEPIRLFQCLPKELSIRKYPPLRIDNEHDKLEDDELASQISGGSQNTKKSKNDTTEQFSSTHSSDGDYDAASRDAALAKLVRRHWRDPLAQQVATSRLNEAFTFIMGTMTTSSGAFRRDYIAQVAKAWRVDAKIDTTSAKAASGAKEEAALLSVLVKVLKNIQAKEKKATIRRVSELGDSLTGATSNGVNLPTPTNKQGLLLGASMNSSEAQQFTASVNSQSKEDCR